MLTDGYVSSETKVGIDLVDEDCIKFLSQSIGQKYNTYKSSKTNVSINAQPRHRLLLSDKDLVNNLKRFGIVANKTYNLQPPKLFLEEEKYLPYLIRGIIDGDGCVFKTSYGAPSFYIMSKSKDFIDWIENVLINKFFMKDIRVNYTSTGVYRLETANQENILKLLVLIYDKPFGMERKYIELQRMFRDYNSDLLLK